MEIFPDIATNPEFRPLLKKVLSEVYGDSSRVHALSFHAFLRLTRHLQDLQERDAWIKEQKAVKATRFTPSEVEDMRELFMGFREDEDKVRTKVTLSDLKRTIDSVTRLNTSQVHQLGDIFSEIVNSGHSDSAGGCKFAHFPEFLFIMRRLFDINFAGLREASEKVKEEASSAKDTGNDEASGNVPPLRRFSIAEGTLGSSNVCARRKSMLTLGTQILDHA